MLDSLLELFAEYGYYFLFAATLMENIPILGAFMPGEVVVVAAGFFAAQGEFDIVTVYLVASAGATIGTSIGYLIGRHGGRPLIETMSGRFHIKEGRVKAAEQYFDSHGPRTVFIGRYVAGVKAFVAALAGAAHMRYPLFFGYALAGVLSWTAIACFAGYFFGQNFDLLMTYIQAFGWVAMALALAIVAFVVYRSRRRAKEE